jgi:hypothetical protein
MHTHSNQRGKYVKQATFEAYAMPIGGSHGLVPADCCFPGMGAYAQYGQVLKFIKPSLKFILFFFSESI